MVVYEFGTETADYRLRTGKHFARAPAEDVVEDVDGIVLESGDNRYEDVELDALAESPKYREVIERNADGAPAPIYLVDLPSGYDPEADVSGQDAEQAVRMGAFYASELSAIGSVLAAGAGHPLVAAGLAAGSLPAVSMLGSALTPDRGPLKEIGSLWSATRCWDPAAYRSAVAADKIDNWIVPRLSQETEQPTVFIDYGRHPELKPMLKYPRLRAFTERIHAATNHFPYDTAYRNRVCAFQPVDDADLYEKAVHEFDA